VTSWSIAIYPADAVDLLGEFAALRARVSQLRSSAAARGLKADL
jgi:hypothetical protein